MGSSLSKVEDQRRTLGSFSWAHVISHEPDGALPRSNFPMWFLATPGGQTISPECASRTLTINGGRVYVRLGRHAAAPLAANYVWRPFVSRPGGTFFLFLFVYQQPITPAG